MGRCRNLKGSAWVGECRNWKGCGWAPRQTRGQPHPVYLPTIISVFCLYFVFVFVFVFVLASGWPARRWDGETVGGVKKPYSPKNGQKLFSLNVLIHLCLYLYLYLYLCICALWVGFKQDKKRPTQSIYLPSLVTCFKPKALFWSQKSIFVICHQKTIEKNMMMRRTGLSSFHLFSPLNDEVAPGDIWQKFPKDIWHLSLIWCLS